MLRTGKVSSLKVEKEAPKAVQEIRLASPQPQEPAFVYSAPKSPITTPLNLHSIKSDISPASSPIASPIEPLNFANPSTWHKPVNSPNPYPNYLAFPGFPYPPNEAYNRLYHHQISPVRDSSLSPPSYISSRNIRDSSISPPAPVFIQPYVTSDYRRSSSALKPTESYSQHHRYMPYQLNHHHHHNLLPVDQSSLSPTSSHASYNSFASSSNASMRSISPRACHWRICQPITQFLCLWKNQVQIQTYKNR